MKAKWIVMLVVLVVLAVAALCLLKGGASSSGHLSSASDAVLDAPQGHRTAVSSANGNSEGPGMSSAGSNVVDERRAAHRAAVEASRSEYEAFMKMSPEEQQRFRERKREEMLARHRASRGKKGVRGGRQHGTEGGVSAAAAGDAAQSEESSERTARAEQEELRAAALKARAEYEDSMGETRAANYRRRSVNYWMNRVKRQRERVAERELRRSSDVMGADAGASAADSQEQETKGKAE